MADALSELVDNARIVAIDEAAVPAAPQAADRRDQWFVNCHYRESMSTSPAPRLLHEAKEDALAILQRLVGRKDIADCAEVVVSIYAHIPVAGAERPARRRAYRLAVRASDLLNRELPLSLEALVQLPIFEDSQLDHSFR